MRNSPSAATNCGTWPKGLYGRRIGPRLALLLALLVSASLFGILHLLQPNATAVSSLNIFFAGVLMSVPYLLTGELAIPIGLHLGWNFFEGICGFAVSGLTSGYGLLRTQQVGPAAWTGGEFGPEAGLLALGFTVLGCG